LGEAFETYLARKAAQEDDSRPIPRRHPPARRLATPDAPQYVAEKAAEARDENAWAFWLEVERAVKELLSEAAPPDATQH
jgi:hypothetical protein